MRIKVFRASIVSALLAAVTGCTAAGGPPRMSFWPFNKKEKPADALASAGPAPAFPVKPSTTAQPSGTPTGGAKSVASTPSSASPAAASAAGYPSTGPVVDYGGTVASNPYSANPAGYTSASPSGSASSYPSSAPPAQVGRYDAGGYGGAPSNYPPTRPAGYEQPASAAPPAGRYDASPYDAPPAESPLPSSSGRYDNTTSRSGAAPQSNASSGYPSAAGGAWADAPSASAADRYDAPPSDDAAANDPSSVGGGYETPTASPPYSTTQEDRYAPGATGYQPGRTGYNPPGTEPYSSPSGAYASPAPLSSTETSADPHYRPGGTGDYVPGSATTRPQGSSARTAAAPRNFATPASSDPTSPSAAYPSTTPSGGYGGYR